MVEPERSLIHVAEPARDERGARAALHGIGILHRDGRFWAWGENKRRGDRFSSIDCYSSEDLAVWRFEGEALASGTGDLGPDRIVERPKVLYCDRTGVFVMFVHVDTGDYAAARVGIAVAATPRGPYEYVRSFRPLGNLSRDIGVYQEGDRGYLLSEDREHGLHIYELTPDYLDVAGIVATTRKDGAAHGYESPSLVRAEGLYYLFGSDLTGWHANDNRYSTARTLSGPWSAWSPFAPVGSNTFDSQVSVVLPVATAGGTAHVYFGDRWRPQELSASLPVWLPIELSEGRARMPWRAEWSLAELP